MSPCKYCRGFGVNLLQKWHCMLPACRCKWRLSWRRFAIHFIVIEAARGKLDAFIGVASAREIVFTRHATEAINLVARTGCVLRHAGVTESGELGSGGSEGQSQ